MENNPDITTYENLVKRASELYLDKQFQKALVLYNDALKIATDTNMSKMIMWILKYMICCCLFESNKLEDLAEVVNILQSIDKAVKNRFPAVYCLLAQTHCKLFRFELAEMEFRNANAIFTTNSTLESFCIPGTDSPIRPTNKDDETWSKIKQDCLAYHQPDAICSFPDCNYVTKPYVIPSKTIFLKDPAFNGMVIINCNNKDQPCVLKFHQYCWKMKKDELYPISKVSDKDIVGVKCFTPNCLNDDTACVISSIQVIDQKGELKAHIKENPCTAWSVKSQDKNDKNISKGAVKKLKSGIPISKISENRNYNVQQLLMDSLSRTNTDTLTAKHVQSENDSHYCDESQIIVVKDAVVNADFLNDPPAVAGEKSFLLSFFLDYIKKNNVRISDVYSKFKEYNQDLHLKDLDILDFLLQTNNFEIQSNKVAIATSTEEVISQLNQSSTAKDIDIDDSAAYIDDVYYELMNEKDTVYVDGPEHTTSTNDYNFNTQDSYFNVNLSKNFEQQFNSNNVITYKSGSGGDTSEHSKISLNSLTNQLLESNTKFDFIQSPPSPSKQNESKKLNDYISKLESDMEKLLDENTKLRKEIVNKDNDLEHFKKERENYHDKMKKCEQLFEKMGDFQKEYDNAMKEKLKIKEELVNVMKEKNYLEIKLEELEDPETKRTEFMKLFQEEYKMLQEALSEEWESRTEILKKSLKSEIEIKMTLLNKLLNAQYSNNKHVLTRYLDQCSDFVEVTSKVNAWMESNMNIKNFCDNSEWLKRLELLQQAANELQFEYMELRKKLDSEKGEKFKMTDINLKTTAIPNPPNNKLCNIVLDALNAYCRHQYQIIQNYMLKAQVATQAATQVATHAMQYQMHSVTQSQTYNSVQTGYVQQYPYATNYTTGQPNEPIPLIGVTPVPTYQMTPRTAGPPPNLTLQQVLPTSQTSLSASSESSISVDNAEIDKSKPLSIEQSIPTKVADAVDSNENFKVDAKDMKENEFKTAEKIESFKDKIAQMREAFKTIALNVKEKSKLERSVEAEEQAVTVEQTEVAKLAEKLTIPTTKTANQLKDTDENGLSTIKTEPIEQAQSINDLVFIREDRSDISIFAARDDLKSQKRVGMDGLVKMLLKKFPGAMECDVIEAIAKIRKERNNALTGISVSQIIEEAKPHIHQSQSLHVIRYFVNDGSK